MRDFLDKASKAYYEGNPIMTDAEFDYLSSKYDYSEVGYRSDFKFSHLYPMRSLQKCYPGDVQPFPSGTGATVVTPKLDGAAVSLRYYNGQFVLGLTRGDGQKGVDVTEKLGIHVPSTIDYAGEIQITGELVCPKSVPNARNVAAGSLNLKDLEEFKTRPLTFVAYDIQPHLGDLWSEDMEELRLQGFNTVLESDWQQFPQDGKVFRLDSIEKFNELGYTAHHPRGAFAYKERQVGVRTRLLDVEWKVGKSGVVSPVAILEPVIVGEATVSRATLHNIAYIESLDLEIGCDVEVIRSGEIIPRIVRKL
jgi:NAD-dependent DNA ligase